MLAAHQFTEDKLLFHEADGMSRIFKKSFDPGRTRTCNPLIRSQMPYPLGHRTFTGEHSACPCFLLNFLQPSLIFTKWIEW